MAKTHEYCCGGVPFYANAFADANREFLVLTDDDVDVEDCELVAGWWSQPELTEIVWQCVLNDGNGDERREDYDGYVWLPLRYRDSLYILPDGGW